MVSKWHSCDLSPAHQHRWRTFSIWRTFFHRERERDHSEHAMPYHAIPINKYAKQKQQVHQSKQQICHLNQKNTPTKTPSTPSQPKEYANQNTKYAISIKRVRQPKHQVRHLNQKNTQPKHQIHNLNQKNTPMWILVPNIDLRCFVVRQLLSRIYALFRRTIWRSENCAGVQKVTNHRYGFLYWSSSWRWQPHIGVCRMLWPLLRAGMAFLTHFFCKMYFSYIVPSQRKEVGFEMSFYPPEIGRNLWRG